MTRKRKRRPGTIARHGNKAGKMPVTHGSDNVFKDVGFGSEEAANLKVRADLLLDLRQYIQARGNTSTSRNGAAGSLSNLTSTWRGKRDFSNRVILTNRLTSGY